MRDTGNISGHQGFDVICDGRILLVADSRERRVNVVIDIEPNVFSRDRHGSKAAEKDHELGPALALEPIVQVLHSVYGGVWDSPSSKALQPVVFDRTSAFLRDFPQIGSPRKSSLE